MMGKEACVHCKHSYLRHMHTMHKARPEVVIEDNLTVAQDLQNAVGRRSAIDRGIIEAKRQAEAYSREYNRILEISARFAQSVRANAILEFNESLGDYLRIQIKKLEGLGDRMSETQKKSLDGYKKSLQRYEEEVRIFEAAVAQGDARVPTDTEANELVKELESLPLTGESFRNSI